MKTVALVAPYFQENTLRFLRALVELPGVRATVITQDGFDRVPADLKAALVSARRVGSCLDADSLIEACRSLEHEVGPIDVILGVLEQLQIPVAQVRDALGIPGMSAETARNFRDKARMKEVLRKAGVPCARHRRVESADDAWALVREVGYPIVVKPPDGLGAKSTFRLNDDNELREAMDALHPSPSNPLQAEEFMKGEENTCETVSVRGKPVWRSGTRYLPGPLTVLENPWIQYCVLLPREDDGPDFQKFHPTNDRALSALGMGTGLSHMEWFQRADGTHAVSEVGARPPGVHIMPLMSIAHGVDMIRAWVRLMVLEEFDPPRRTHAAGAAFLRGQGAGRHVVRVRGLEPAMAEVGSHVVEARLPRLGQPAAAGYEGEGFVLFRHERTDVVRDALQRLVSLVRVDLG